MQTESSEALSKAVAKRACGWGVFSFVVEWCVLSGERETEELDSHSQIADLYASTSVDWLPCQAAPLGCGSGVGCTEWDLPRKRCVPQNKKGKDHVLSPATCWSVGKQRSEGPVRRTFMSC